MTRKQFLQTVGLSAVSALGIPRIALSAEPEVKVPSYLKAHEALYRKDPRAAALEWLVKSRWGLFVHYSLHSLRGITAKQAAEKKSVSGAEWKKLKQSTAEEHARLEKSFTAAKFDA